MEQKKNGKREAEQEGRGELSEDAEPKEKRKVVKDGQREREERKISSPGGIICHLSH